MANFAKVENGSITGVYDLLPRNTERVSNFHIHENDIEFIKSLGWYKLVKVTPEYNQNTQKIDNAYQWFDAEADVAYESYQVIDLPPPPEAPAPLSAEQLQALEEQRKKDQWFQIRGERDLRIKDFEWRYLRYDREVRLGLTPTDSLERMDRYVQDLADITKQEDPFNIIWPNY